MFYGCLPLGAKAQRVYGWDEAHHFIGFSPLVRHKALAEEHLFWYTHPMGYKQTTTICIVQIVPYRVLSSQAAALCEMLRREAGRCWTDMVEAHSASRSSSRWLTEADLNALTKGGRYRLHSQSVQALSQKLIANIDTARALRAHEQMTGSLNARYPHHPKLYQTVTWKDQAIRVRFGRIHLPNGRGQTDLVLPLPEHLQKATIRKAELLWRADNYQLALTIEQPPHPPLRQDGQTAGVDLGEINMAAACTEHGQALVINGRLLRHHKQLRNKRHAAYQERLARCRKGSRRWKRLKRQKARASTKLYRQQRNHLHQASRKLVDFALAEDVSHLVIGDVRDCATGVDKGAHANQKISQWPHGQFVTYVTYKARRQGIGVSQIDEAYSSRTCSHCAHVRRSTPRGRVFKCPGCGVQSHRDANGAANIVSRAVYGAYGCVHVQSLMHRRATVVRAPTRAPVVGGHREAPSAFVVSPKAH
jgi:putative transposase